MNLKLIRWQLPLSYAAIALLTVLSLGAVLVITLRSYYTERERVYLLENGAVVQAALAPLLSSPLSNSALQAQVENLSALMLARVRVLDNQQGQLADSGSPTMRDIITFSPVPFQLALSGSAADPLVLATPMAPLQPVPPGSRPDVFFQGPAAAPGVQTAFLYSAVPVSGIITSTQPISGTFGLVSIFPEVRPFSIFDESAGVGGGVRRSSTTITFPLQDSTGRVVGQVQLSEGPAYGWAIVSSVSIAWLIAGGIAVLLAAGVGWLISRRVTAPLNALTQVTQQMAAGDLSVRAWEGNVDEFDALAHSFNRMAGQVEGTVLTLRNFVSDAAHELQTPLTALRTNLELALEEKELDRQADFLYRAKGQEERLSGLTQSLLDLSRMESGANQDSQAPVDLAVLLQEASETYAARAEQGGQSFSLEIPKGVSPVWGDEAQLRRAVGNLLDNAVKFTPSGGSIHARLEHDGEQVRLVVEDSGIGIPVEDLPSLFSRFHRGRNAAGYPGSGLGLAMVRAVAQSHGGRVTAENLPSGGSRFTFSFPLYSIPIGEPRKQ